MEIYIYKHTSPSGKCYIGQTVNIKKRWCAHAYSNCPKFYKAIKKYGWENIQHEILCVCHDAEEANKAEANFIESYNSINNGYNIAAGAGSILRGENNPMYGKSATDFMTEEEISAWKLKLSEAQKGENNGFYGKHHSAESIERMRQKKIGVSHKLNLSDKQREAISERGKKLWTDERKRGQSEKMTGANNPMFGKVVTAEERQRMHDMYSGGNSVLAKPLVIIDTLDNTEIYCECRSQAKSLIGLDKTHVHRYINTGKLYKNRYIIKEAA